MPYCAYVDVSGIQDFVFQSSRLAANADASAYLDRLAVKDKGLFWTAGDQYCIMAAAGNAAYRADSADELRGVIRTISLQLLKDKTGLQIVAALVPYKEGALAEGCQQALLELERQKLIQPRSVKAGLPGLHPAPYGVKMTEEDGPDNEANAADREMICGLHRPRELERMLCVGTEESSLMAVVAVDGIRMGGKVFQWMEKAIERQQTQGWTDEDFVKEYRCWSEQLKARWACAWAVVEQSVCDAFRQPIPEDHDEEQAKDGDKRHALHHPVHNTSKPPLRWIALRRKKDDSQDDDSEKAEIYLPCRRVYQGGDDLTFVCDARIALTLTTILIRELEVETETGPEEFRYLRCSAGILFCNVTFPFVRAVQLAGNVGANAKKAAVDTAAERSELHPPSTIDWWMNRQGDMKRPEPLRQSQGKALTTLKPYHLREPRGKTPSWEHVENTWLGSTSGLWSVFATQRNKWKDIVAAAEHDPRALGLLLALRPVENPCAPGQGCLSPLGSAFLAPLPVALQLTDHPGDGFDESGQTPLLDLGEIFDMHYPFSEVQEGAKA